MKRYYAGEFKFKDAENPPEYFVYAFTDEPIPTAGSGDSDPQVEIVTDVEGKPYGPYESFERAQNFARFLAFTERQVDER